MIGPQVPTKCLQLVVVDIAVCCCIADRVLLWLPVMPLCVGRLSEDLGKLNTQIEELGILDFEARKAKVIDNLRNPKTVSETVQLSVEVRALQPWAIR